MKQIVTVIRPHLAEEVLTSLRRAPIEALSVTEVKGYGRQKSYLDEYQETEYSQAFVPKVEITLWVDDSRCEEVLEKIVAVARCGRIGDGKILVMPVSEFLYLPQQLRPSGREHDSPSFPAMQYDINCRIYRSHG